MDGTLAPIPDVLLPEYECDVDVAIWSAQAVNSSYGLAGSVRPSICELPLMTV